MLQTAMFVSSLWNEIDLESVLPADVIYYFVMKPCVGRQWHGVITNIAFFITDKIATTIIVATL